MRDWTYRGKTLQEIQALSLTEFARLVTSRSRRSLLRGFTGQEKILMRELEKERSNVKTHCRDMIILPMMVGKLVRVHNGKEFQPLTIEPDMLGHRLGEFAMTRKKVGHSAPGIGATRSSASLSVR